MKKKGGSLLIMILFVAVIAVLAMFIIRYIDGEIAVREKMLSDVTNNLNGLETRESQVTAEIKRLDEGKYLVAKAREYDYVLPGEIVFIVDEELLED